MEKLPSLIAPYLNAAALQGQINRIQPLLVQGWYNKRFVWGPQKNTLTFSTVIGETRIASLASVIDRDSASPVRSRPGLRKVLGEIPAIKHYRFLKEEDARLILEMGELNATNSGRLNEVFDLIYNDAKYVVDGVENRIDDFCAQALSKGFVEIKAENNPDGIVQEGYIDMYLPSRNRLVSDADWSDPSTDIIKDITDTTRAAQTYGHVLSTMLIDVVKFYDVIKNTSVQNFLKGYNNPGSNNTYAVTLGQLNIALTANLLPTFELVNIQQMVEEDGIQIPYKPWETVNVTFVPNGNLGVIHNARAIEDGLRPVTGVSYSKSNRTLVSKWSTNEPFREYTKAELNAFPGVEQINQIYILKTDGLAW